MVHQKHFMEKASYIFLISLALAILTSGPALGAEIPFSPVQTVGTNFQDASSVVTADVDGDGDIDVIGASSMDDDICWWENIDDGGWTEHILDENNIHLPSSVSAADFDNDGDIDIIGAGFDEGDIIAWENTNGDGSAWERHSISTGLPGVSGIRHIYTTDLNNNGDIDILGALNNANGGGVAWINNINGAEDWTGYTIDDDFGAAVYVYPADIDGDGDLDVIGAGYNADAFKWWENGNAWAEHTIVNGLDGAAFVSAADIDGDEDLDIIGSAYTGSTDELSWWTNDNGNGLSWTRHNLCQNGCGAPHTATPVDLDQDGDIDILTSYLASDRMAWWENTSSNGSTWTERPIGPIDVVVDGAKSGCTADFDGDGDLDIVAAATSSGTILWWENWRLEPDYTLYFTAGPNGTLTGEAAQIVEEENDSNVVTAVPNSGYIFTNWSGSYTGAVNPLIIRNVVANGNYTANFTDASEDNDDDGVLDEDDEEPNNAQIATPNATTGTGVIKIDTSSESGAPSLSETRAVSVSDPSINQESRPDEYEFKDGLVAFKVITTPGATVEVKITFPTDIPADAKYYKVDGAGNFYEFTNIIITGNTVILILTDGVGVIGDKDGLRNGIIDDPGGVAVPSPTGSTGSSGGSCFISTTAY